MNLSKAIGLCAFLALTITFFVFDVGQYLTLEFFTTKKSEILDYYQHSPLNVVIIYALIYVVVTGLSLPGAAVLTLIGGAIFELWWGVLIVSFASTIGATIAFLVSRFLLRNWVQARFEKHLKSINEGIERDGSFYLFTLRLVPLFPFFVINLVMGLTPIRTAKFFIVSQVGMLAGTFVFVNAGTQLAQIDSLKGILSPGLLLSFTLLGIFPLLAKKMVDFWKSKRNLRRYKKPREFDTNLVVIGAGSGGLVASYIAAAVKAKVTLIEKNKMGGDCLNTGCVPSKALIRSAKIRHYISRSNEFGIELSGDKVNFSDVMGRVGRVIKAIEPHDSVERYSELGVDCIEGEAKITSPYTVEVNGSEIRTRNIIIATGARPSVPPIKGVEDIGYLTSDTLWGLKELPKRLLVIGAGPIGCELAQSFSRLGSEVTLLDIASTIMPREDKDVSDYIYGRLESEGVDIKVAHKPVLFDRDHDKKYLAVEYAGSQLRIDFDELIIASGRKANIENIGLESLKIECTPQGTLEVNEYLQTNYPNIYACGDIVGPYQFTHMAAHQSWYAAVNALFGFIWKFKVDYSVVPWATFTDPQVGRVGLNEQDAKAKNINYEVTRFDIDDLDRAIADGEAKGFIKILTVPGKDKILGATIVGPHASELITEYITAMKHGIGLNKILGTIHIYPTLSEANKYVAGKWKQAHKPEKVLNALQWFHAWMRRAQTKNNDADAKQVDQGVCGQENQL